MSKIKNNSKYNDIHSFGGNREKAIQRDGEKCVKCGMTREEHRKKYGRDITVDHIDGKGKYSKIKNHKMSNLQTLCCKCHGYKESELNTRFKSRAIWQMDLDGRKIKKFSAIMDAQRELGLPNSRIRRVLIGERHKYHGYKWVYA